MPYLRIMTSPADYLKKLPFPYEIFDKSTALSLYKPRDPFANKGTYGHALILAGSYGKIGAAVLAAKACLSAGAGLLTTHLPGCGYAIMQSSIPEAMVHIDEDEFSLTSHPKDLDIFTCAGFGPGIGGNEATTLLLERFIKTFCKPLILDADALNIIGRHNKILSLLNPQTIITPHPKEFDRVFGPSADDTARFKKAKTAAVQYKIIIVLKGHYTGIFYPDGKITFNTSGNAGMAKGGSGDVLTGMITALLAQSYAPSDAAALAVFLHGSAGDLAAGLYSEEAMMPTDLIACLGKIFLEWKMKKQEMESPSK
jgi:ADP-dependent NAD(P)H-hydrate dehydratase / NAD(P)H-hydrate epimerase